MNYLSDLFPGKNPIFPPLGIAGELGLRIILKHLVYIFFFFDIKVNVFMESVGKRLNLKGHLAGIATRKRYGIYIYFWDRFRSLDRDRDRDQLFDFFIMIVIYV